MDNENIKTPIGKIGNYYGRLSIKKEGAQHYWSIENYNGHHWEEIPETLYLELLKFDSQKEQRA